MTKEILNEIAGSVVEGNYERTVELCDQALQEGHTAAEIIVDGLSTGMRKCGKKYGKKGMFLDTILWSTAAFQMGLASVSSASDSEQPKKTGKVVLGVMDGPWTIGKDIVSAVLGASNFEVIDAGSDVSPAKVAKAVKDSGAEVVAIGLYLSYRADAIRQLEEELFKAGLRHKTKIILSGPSANRKLAGEFGADAYAKTAEDVAGIALKAIEERKSEMTSRERVMTSLSLKEPDRVPLVPFAMTFSARFAGIPFKRYVSDAAALAEAEVKTARAFGWDAAIVSTDVGAYASAFGAKVHMPDDDVPRLVEPAIRLECAREDFERLDPPESYLDRGRVAEMIQAVGLIKKEVGDELAIIGWTEGPFQGVMLLFGADPRALFLMKQDPGLLKEIIAWYGEFELAVAKAMIDAGADIIGAGESVGYFMSPETFIEYVHPFEKEIFKKISDYGAPVLIHCCGYVPQCIGFAPEVNPGGAIQFDYQVNLAKAKRQIGNTVTIMGNLDCNRLLHLGSEKDVEKACRKAIEQAGLGGGFWLSGGCEIPRDMPFENMRAMLRAVKEYGRYPLGSDSSNC
ncbi:MAG: cobalamin B12-binding domain-containing protein [Candidatus Abyssubacteria bacterium]|nr:cobalamin B12-binding domain-containing protein [Candidatus Abyssubacteria bacterium]